MVTLTHRLRNYLLAGIVVSAPITITLFIVWQVLSYVDQTVTPFIPAAYNPENYLPFGLPGHRPRRHPGPADHDRLAAAAGLVGRTVMRTGERLLDRTPIVRGIYSTLKQLFETRAVADLADLPRGGADRVSAAGIWSVGVRHRRAHGRHRALP